MPFIYLNFFISWQGFSEPAVNQRKHKSRFQAAWNQDFTELNVVTAASKSEACRLITARISFVARTIVSSLVQKSLEENGEKNPRRRRNEPLTVSIILPSLVPQSAYGLSFRWSLLFWHPWSLFFFFVRICPSAWNTKIQAHSHTYGRNWCVVKIHSTLAVWHSAHPFKASRRTNEQLRSHLKANTFSRG